VIDKHAAGLHRGQDTVAAEHDLAQIRIVADAGENVLTGRCGFGD
jgi:hypothetical protein